MADPAAANMTVDLASLLVGGGGTATGSALVGYFLAQWKAGKNGNGSLKGLEQKIEALVGSQREQTVELKALNGELREFIGYMKASVK
jgi:hypothetical protein